MDTIPHKVLLSSSSLCDPRAGAQGVRWASKKAAGSTRNGRKSAGRRLGLKCGDGE